MAHITLKGTPVKTLGEIPQKGQKAPDFKLTQADLKDVTLKDFAGKRKVLNIFPSIDTPTCALSVKHFNKEATDLADTVVLNISQDLPFALGRFCAVEGITHAKALSGFRSTFVKDYQLQIEDSPLAGLASRAVIVLDKDDRILYSEQVAEIAQEPNYAAALQALR